MALKNPIKITSNDIYQIDNPKVIDNQVDRVEVEARLPQIINDTQNVYNEVVTDGDYAGPTQMKMEHNEYQKGATRRVSLAFVETSQVLVYKRFIIPKKQANTRILSLLLGLNKEGNTNIQYSLRGNIKKGDITGSIYIKEYSVAGGLKWEDLNTQESEPTTVDLNVPYSLPISDDRKVEFTQKGTGDHTTDVTAVITLDKKDNVDTAKLESEDDEDFIIALDILAGLRTLKFGGDIPIGTTGALSGTYEDYYPTEVNVSFYGNTISLNLENKTLSFGTKSLGDVFSFGGNELIQTTNTIPEQPLTLVKASSLLSQPLFSIQNDIEVRIGDKVEYDEQLLTIKDMSSGEPTNILFDNADFGKDLADGTVINATLKFRNIIEQQYKDLIEKWKQGKEVATLKCGVNDYYDIEGNKVISPNVYLADYPISMEVVKEITPTQYEVRIYGNEAIDIDDRLYLGKEQAIVITDLEYVKEFVWSCNIQVVANGGFAKMLGKGQFVANKNNPPTVSLPMSFHIGDTVIPYVYGNNGQDKPMSMYKDGTPKQFNVVGKKMISDGGIWQQITLQET